VNKNAADHFGVCLRAHDSQASGVFGILPVDTAQDDEAYDRRRPFLSIVAPCFNEEVGVTEFHRRVRAACDQVGKRYEIVLVNDGSTDGTWEVLERLAAADPAVVAVNLSRNFGQERALAAGLMVCGGERILILDADLQDPPELLLQMLDVMEHGADVVYGKRRSRAGETWFKKATASAFYRLMDSISSIPIPRDTGPFRLMSRRVLNVLLQMPEQSRYTRGLVSWVGFHQVPFLYDREARVAGETHWPLRRMASLAGDAISGFSLRPLRLSGYCSAGCLVTAVVGFAWWLIDWFVSGSPNGWLAIFSTICGLHGVQLFGTYVLGEYVGRMSDQSRGRPLFIVESVLRSPVSSHQAKE
jgi:polyisoprenyl-phosphate glycosyltransferase